MEEGGLAWKISGKRSLERVEAELATAHASHSSTLKPALLVGTRASYVYDAYL